MNGNAVEVRGLYKSFGDVQAVNGVSFDVPEGTVVGLLGPNGAGKTTTIRMLTTVLHADAGEATVMGYDIWEQAEEVRKVIGVTGQFAAIDENLTSLENLSMVGRLNHMTKGAVKNESEYLLELFELADVAKRPVKTFSGGMKRRLDIAASLIATPQVLFLDEPTTGVDPKNRVALWEIVRRLVSNGTTIFLTTQYLEEADRLADNLVIIDHGIVIDEGTPEGLKAKHGKDNLDDVFLFLTEDNEEV